MNGLKERNKVSKCKQIKYFISPENLFLVIMCINIVIMFLVMLFGSEYRNDIMRWDGAPFYDFFAQIDRVEGGNVYGNMQDNNAVYPPFVSVWFELMLKLASFQRDISVDFSLTRQGMMLITMYIVVFVMLFAAVVFASYKTRDGYRKVVLVTVFILSYPFWRFAFDRGNPVIYAMLFSFAGLSLRYSDNKIIRELALISLAVAANIKFYPAILGIVWLIEKRYKEAARLVVYGVILFVLPFFRYLTIGRGVNPFLQYFEAFSRYGGNVLSENSIMGSCWYVLGEKGLVLGKVLTVLWLLWVLYYSISVGTKEGVNWKVLAILMSTQTILIPASFVYNFVYLAIPIVYFLNSMNKVDCDENADSEAERSIRNLGLIPVGGIKEKCYGMNYIYAILFAIAMTCPPIKPVPSCLFVAWVILLLIISLEYLTKILKKSELKVYEDA